MTKKSLLILAPINSILISLLIFPIWGLLLLEGGMVNRNTIFFGLMLTYAIGAFASKQFRNQPPSTLKIYTLAGGGALYLCIALILRGPQITFETPLPLAFLFLTAGIYLHHKQPVLATTVSLILGILIAIFAYQ